MIRRKIPYYGNDSWGLMLWARYFKEKVPREKFCKFLISEEKFYYPDFYPRMLSLFNQDKVLKYNRFFSPAIDTLNFCLLFLLSYFLQHNILETFVACFVYLLFPPLIYRTASLTARIAGYFLFNLTMLSLILTKYFHHPPIMIIASCIFGALLLNTHKMSTQALVFVLLGLSVIQRSFFYLAALFFIFVIAVIFSKGFYIDILNGHLKYLYTNYKNIHSSPFDKFNLKASVLKSIFWGFLIFIVYIALPKAHTPLFITAMFIWVLILYITFVLTTFIVSFRSIGEGYRYLEYAIIPISVLFPLTMQKKETQFLGTIIFLFYFLFSIKTIYSHYFDLKKDFLNIVDDARIRMFKFIATSSIDRILCIPSNMSQSSAYFTGKKILWSYYDWDNYKWLFPGISFPLKFDLTEVLRKYNLGAILLHTKFAERKDLNIDNILIHREGPYLLLGIKQT